MKTEIYLLKGGGNLMATLAGLRAKAGLTQAEVAKVLNVTQGAISIWECGDGKPKLSKIPTLAKLYGTTEQIILSACMEKPNSNSYYVMKRKRRKFSPSTSIINHKGANENGEQ